MFKEIFVFSSLLLFAQESPSENIIAEKVVAAEAENFWKYHHSASIGYRRDRQEFSESGTKADYTDRNTLQLILGSHLEWHQIVLYLGGSYGWLIDGNFHFSVRGNRFGDSLFFNSYDLGAGYTADAAGTLGFRIKCWDRPNFGISLIPSGGYKYSHLMNFPEGENKSVLPGAAGFALGRFSSPNQQDWFGPFVEGWLEFRFWEICEWVLFYQYHWPTVRSKSKEEVDLYLFNSPTNATAIDLFRSSSIYKASYIDKQSAGTYLRVRIPSGWNFGAYFEGSGAWTHKAKYHSKQTREQYILAPTGTAVTFFDAVASIHWVCYAVSISLGYQF